MDSAFGVRIVRFKNDLLRNAADFPQWGLIRIFSALRTKPMNDEHYKNG